LGEGRITNVRPGLFLTIGDYLLNTNLIAAIQLYYHPPAMPGATPISQTKGGIVRIWLDSHTVAPAYAGPFAGLPAFLDVTAKAEIAHVRKLCTSWAETGIALNFTGITLTATAPPATPEPKPPEPETRVKPSARSIAQRKRQAEERRKKLELLKQQQEGGGKKAKTMTA
jgi:hypothetical protein